MSEIDLEAVESGLRDAPWGPIRGNPWSSQNTVHEKIKADLHFYAIKQDFIPVPEFHPIAKKDERNYRIDIGWFEKENYSPFAAFEVDGGVAERSVMKLNSLGDSVGKIIVSKSPNKTYIQNKKEENLPNDFYHIDAQVWK